MENNCDQAELAPFDYEISDESLEIAAASGADKSNITLWYCTALYFCLGP